MLATPATPDTCEPASAPETREGARIKRNAHQDHPCAARESIDPMNLAIELQAELAATNMTLQAENQMHAAQVHNSRDLVQVSKDAVKSFVEAGHKQ